MKNTSMLITTIVMAALSAAALFVAYQKGRHVEGLVNAKNLTLQVLPLLVFALLLAGTVQVLIPKAVISQWLGQESGLKGILIGSAAGAFLPGGPFVTLPIVMGFVKIGTSIPVAVAMITGWALLSIARFPMEVGILGPKLALIRLASVIVLAPLAGLMASLIMKVFKVG
jgi:uncharacterized membrane protein YraQ (UPF0718 family)